jgi:hypothetical protein
VTDPRRLLLTPVAREHELAALTGAIETRLREMLEELADLSRLMSIATADGAGLEKLAEPDRVLRREGDYWTLAYDGVLLRLRDAKGLRYLAQLVERPGTELHVLELVGTPQPNGARDARHACLSLRTDLDTGPLLDAAARASYRARLRELDEELACAARSADTMRSARAEEEIQMLGEQLAAAVGLGGRNRRGGSLAERARINVTRSLKSAIVKVGASHPPLARHLRTSLKTGTFCSYNPSGQALRVPQ